MAKLKNIILQDGGKIILDTESKEPSLSIETTSGKLVKLNIKGNVELSGGSITVRLPGSTVDFDLPTVVNNLGKQYESNKKNLEDLIDKHNQRTKELSDFIEANEEQSTQFARDFENMQGVNAEISERIRGYEEEASFQATKITELSGKLESNSRELNDLLSQNSIQSIDLQNFLDEAMDENGAISLRLDGLRSELKGQIDSTASLMLSTEDVMNQIAEAMSQNLQESEKFRTTLESMISTNGDINNRIVGLRGELEGQIASANDLLATVENNLKSSVAQIEKNKKDSEDFQIAFTNLTSENGDIATRINGLRENFETEIAATAELIQSTEEIMSEIATSITENRIESETFKNVIDGMITENSSIQSNINVLRQDLQSKIDDTNNLLNTVSESLDQTAQAVKDNKDESERWRTETLPGIITTNADVAGQINTAKGELQGKIDGINRNLEQNYQTAHQTRDAISGLQQTILDSEGLNDKIADAKTGIIKDINEKLGDVESDISRLESNAASNSLTAANIEEALIGSTVIAKQSDVENATNEKIKNLKDTDIHDIRNYAVNATIAAGTAQIEAIAASGSAAQAKNSAELSYDMSTFAKESAISSYSAAGIAIKSSGNALLAVDLAALQAQASMRYAESSAELSGLSSQSATNAGNASRQSADAAGISITAAGESLLASSTALQAATWSDARANRASDLAGQSAASAGLSAQGAQQSATSAGYSIKAAGESLLASSTSLQAATWSDARANSASDLAGQSAASAGLSAQGASQSARSAGISIKASGESLLASSTSLQAATWSDARANRASDLAGQSAASAGLSAQGASQSARSAGISIKASGESLLASSTALQAATWSDARANRASILAGQAGAAAGTAALGAQQSVSSAGISLKAAGDSLLASTTALQAASWSDARANMAGLFATNANTSAGLSLSSAQSSLTSAGLAIKSSGDSLLASTTALQAASWSDARANMAGLFATNANTSAASALSSATIANNSSATSLAIANAMGLKFDGFVAGDPGSLGDLSATCLPKDRNSFWFENGKLRIGYGSVLDNVTDRTDLENRDILITSYEPDLSFVVMNHIDEKENYDWPVTRNSYLSFIGYEGRKNSDDTPRYTHRANLQAKLHYDGGSEFNFNVKNPPPSSGTYTDPTIKSLSIKPDRIEIPSGNTIKYGDRWQVFETPYYLKWKYYSYESGYLQYRTSIRQMNFTGQHRGQRFNEKEEFSVGMIVVSSGLYSNDIGVLEKDNTIHINEALPKLTKSAKRNDKRAFGVVSDEEEKNSSSREFASGNFISVFEKIEGDDRLVINSLGEGAIWVTNINGNLENGDYITTCEIPGYGMKQDDDLLHNYTVAKITCDCDFDLESEIYKCEEFEFEGNTYRKAFVGCTYHCG